MFHEFLFSPHTTVTMTVLHALKFPWLAISPGFTWLFLLLGCRMECLVWKGIQNTLVGALYVPLACLFMVW